jgi:hypothetical protein
MRLVFLLGALLSAGCDGEPCDAGVFGACGNGTRSCDAVTEKCVAARVCSRTAPTADKPGTCSDGFACLSQAPYGDRCPRNCTVEGDGPGDSACAPGYRCDNFTRTCKSILGAPCAIDTSFDDCNGPNCDAASLTCVATIPCTDATVGQCPDGYGCGVRGCYRYCDIDASTCQGGRMCNLATARCE